jgi:hypothetical protein
VNLLGRLLRRIWWEPLLGLTALLFGRKFPLSRAYRVVFGHSWIVVYNGDYCRLYLAPHRRSR